MLWPLGWHCIDVDIKNQLSNQGSYPMDLASDSSWDFYMNSINTFRAVIMGIECKTFSRSRQHPNGPRPLRSKEYPRGLPKNLLSQDDIITLQVANYFVAQCIRLAWLCINLGIAFAIENPEPWDPDAVSIWDIPEMMQLASHDRVRVINFDQCRWGADTAKPTRLLVFNMDASALQLRCNHPERWIEFTDSSGVNKVEWRRHPPLIGRKVNGEFATKAAAAYPTELNKALAFLIESSHKG